MHRKPVDHQYQILLQVSVEFLDEEDDVSGMNVPLLQPVVQTDMPTARRERKCANRGETVATIPHALNRRLAGRRPGSSAIGLEHKATFIEKNDASLPFEAPFLFAATFGGAIVRFPLRQLLAHAAPAFGWSSLRRAGSGERGRHDISLQNVARLRRQSEGTSTDRLRTRPQGDLSREWTLGAAAVPATSEGSYPYGAWVSRNPNLRNPMNPSNALPRRARRSRFAPLHELPYPQATIGRRSLVEPLVPSVFL